MMGPKAFGRICFSIIRMLPKKADYTVVRASVARAMDPQLLADKMLAAGLSVRVSGEGVFETYGKVRDEASPEDAIYIGGSTFVVADLLAGMKGHTRNRASTGCAFWRRADSPACWRTRWVLARRFRR